MKHKLQITITKELAEKLTRAARKNHRSRVKEIAHRLEKSFERS